MAAAVISQADNLRDCGYCNVLPHLDPAAHLCAARCESRSCAAAASLAPPAPAAPARAAASDDSASFSANLRRAT